MGETTKSSLPFIRAITKRIHGDCEGLKDRQFYLKRAKDALQP